MPKNTTQRIIDSSKTRGVSFLGGSGTSTGGTGGTIAATDHGLLTGLGDDDHPQYHTDARGDARYMTFTRTLTAGAGLTGGGDLSADRTFTVGAGFGITVNADDVALASYTAGAGLTYSGGVLSVGAGNGITVNADDVALTTPGTLTVSSTNTATGSHTHAITASSDVGTSPAAALLKSTAGGALTLSSLFVKGSIDVTNNGDLTVMGSGSYAGVQVLFADSSGGNVGILRAPDSQFALDINGPARATYWIGPHALQLKNVVLLSHFDGRMPYNTNYAGEPNGHMGQVATVAGGAIYRPGKFYKALQVAESAYNYCPNPSAETNATGWTQEYNGGTLTSQVRQTITDAPYGIYAVGMTASASSNYVFNAPHFHAPASVTMTWNNGQSATLSCYVWGAGTWRVVFEDSGQNLIAFQEITLTTTDEWQRVVISATNSSGFNYPNVRLSFFPRSSGCTIFVDGVHYEASNRASAYLDGSLGVSPGHSWTGTAHASSSVRNAGSLYYSQTMPTSWTIMFWAYRASWQAGITGYMLGWGSGSVYYNTSNQDIVGPITSTVPADGWHHYCVMYDTAGITRAYRDGAYLGQTSAALTPGTVIYVGWNGSGAQCNGLIDDLCLLERAMPIAADNSCAELRSVYESNAPVFAETSVFSFRPTPKGLIWADDEGLWMRATDGDTVFGIYGNDATTKSWGGQTMSAGDLLIGNASSYVFWDDSAATLAVSGMITATTGAIGGWALGATALTSGTAGTTVGLDSGGTNPALYAGSATPGSAPFRVTNAGALTATNATFGSLKIDTSGAYVDATSAWDVTAGYRFKQGGANAGGLTSRVPTGAAYMALLNNLTAESGTAVSSTVDTVLYLQTAAASAKSSTVTISANRSTTTVGLSLINTSSNSQAILYADTLTQARTGGATYNLWTEYNAGLVSAYPKLASSNSFSNTNTFGGDTYLSGLTVVNGGIAINRAAYQQSILRFNSHASAPSDSNLTDGEVMLYVQAGGSGSYNLRWRGKRTAGVFSEGIIGSF